MCVCVCVFVFVFVFVYVCLYVYFFSVLLASAYRVHYMYLCLLCVFCDGLFSAFVFALLG